MVTTIIIVSVSKDNEDDDDDDDAAVDVVGMTEEKRKRANRHKNNDDDVDNCLLMVVRLRIRRPRRIAFIMMMISFTAYCGPVISHNISNPDLKLLFKTYGSKLINPKNAYLFMKNL